MQPAGERGSGGGGQGGGADKIANAACLVIVWDAIRIAIANEKTMPTFAKVRSSPIANPNSSPGAAFITAELMDGKNAPAPIAPTM